MGCFNSTEENDEKVSFLQKAPRTQ
jgi:hypothetical protein